MIFIVLTVVENFIHLMIHVTIIADVEQNNLLISHFIIILIFKHYNPTQDFNYFHTLFIYFLFLFQYIILADMLLLFFLYIICTIIIYLWINQIICLDFYYSNLYFIMTDRSSFIFPVKFCTDCNIFHNLCFLNNLHYVLVLHRHTNHNSYATNYFP